MSPSIWQIGLIVLLILLLFGAGRLPRIMNDLAKGIKSFRKGLSEDENESAKEEQSAQKLAEDEPQADKAEERKKASEQNESR